jgi:uncharacterized membrane protein (DUF485 family)
MLRRYPQINNIPKIFLSEMAMKKIEQIRQLPEYIALTRARKKIIWPLSTVIITAYFALVLSIAFTPKSLGIPIGNGVTSLGVLLGLSIIFLCFIITGIYVSYANRVLEPLTQAIIKKASAIQ